MLSYCIIFQKYFVLTSIARKLVFEQRFETAHFKASFVACKSPDGELGAGGEDGGEGMGDGVKGRSFGEPKEIGARLIPRNTMGTGGVLFLLDLKEKKSKDVSSVISFSLLNVHDQHKYLLVQKNSILKERS